MVKIPGNSPITEADGWFIGEDQSFQWPITDLDPLTAVSPPVAKDITGWTIQFRMAPTETGASVLTKTATLTTPLSGICTVAVAATDTPGLSPGTFHYTLARIDAGQNQVLAWGTAVLQGRVA